MKIVLFVALVAVLAGLVLLKLSKGAKRTGSFAPRQLATPNEQHMFWRLTEAFPQPEYLVLTQVSFGALLTAKGGASRYSFSQKRADFVVTNKGFKVLAIIELDDASHKGREQADAERDAMLIDAKYRVIRYTSTPTVSILQSDLLKPLTGATA